MGILAKKQKKIARENFYPKTFKREEEIGRFCHIAEHINIDLLKFRFLKFILGHFCNQCPNLMNLKPRLKSTKNRF